MATINGVTFNLTRIIFDTGNRNVLGRSPGSKTNPISNFGMDGLGITLTGFETSQSDYDDVMAAFMGSGSKALVVRTGWKFDIYSTSNNLSEVEGFADNYFPYRFDLVCSDPYQYSTSETTRAKTITANNQEWSADDSANDITTSGTVEAVPDIKVVGGKNTSVGNMTEITGRVTNRSFEDALGAEWAYSEVDSNAQLSGARVNPGSNYKDGTYVYKITQAGGVSSGGDYAKISQSSVDLTEVDILTVWFSQRGSGGYSYVKHRIMIDSDVVFSSAPEIDFNWYQKTADVSEYTGNHTISLVMYFTSATSGAYGYVLQCDLVQLWSVKPNKNITVYNTADTAIKMDVSNILLPTFEHRINVDGTGSVVFSDDFSTSKFGYTCNDVSLATYDSTNDDLDIADGGYIYYLTDTKYPITGIPTLTSQINITAGTPTIQISTDGSTWYDIDTAIVDDVDTEYELDNATSLSLKGKTSFYFRIDCGGTGTVTCSVKSFELDINIVTIDAENPVINTGAANTIRCDQDAASGMNCEVSLIYRDRKWAA